MGINHIGVLNLQQNIYAKIGKKIKFSELKINFTEKFKDNECSWKDTIANLFVIFNPLGANVPLQKPLKTSEAFRCFERV